MKKFRLLSFLCLLMLFASGGYAAIPLTTAQWTGGGTCQYVLFKSTDTAFGLQTPNANQYADLSNYSKLLVTVPEGQPRLFFNATGSAENQRLTVGPEVGTYMTKSGNTYTIDLEKIVADKGSAKLNSIKAAASWVELTVTSMQLVEKTNNAKTWDFTNWSTQVTGSGWQDNTTNYSISNYAYVTSNPNNAGELMTGRYGNGGTVTTVGTVIPETAGLIFSTAKGRLNLHNNGNGIELYATSITIPNLNVGDVITVHSSGNDVKANGNDMVDEGGNNDYYSTYTVTEAGNVVLDNFGNSNTHRFVWQIEVKKASIYFTDLKIDGETDEGANPFKDDFRNNVLSVPYSDIGKTTQFNFQLRDANGNAITTAAPSDFTVTSTDGNVINVSNISITGPNSSGKYTITGIDLHQQGTAYITITYGGITETHPINIKKKPVYIRAGSGAAFTKHLGDPDWFVLFHLCEEGSTTTISLDNVNYYTTSGFKNNTGAVTNTATNLYNGSLNKWFHAAQIGTDVYVIRLRNHPLYEDCDAEFAFTVLKSKQDISYPQDWTFTYDEAEGYGLRNDVHNDLNTGNHTNITINNGIWTYTPSGKQITFKSSDTNVLTVNANTGKIQWTGNAGTATITAIVAGDNNWSENEASFTVTINGDEGSGPRIIWVTGYKGATNGIPGNNDNLDMARGANYGYRWFKTDNQVKDEEGNVIDIIQYENNNIIPYNNDQWFQAVAIKAGTTNEELRNAGLLQYPYKNKETDDYFYYIGDGGWRYDKAPLAQFLYNNSYEESAKIIYTVDVETSAANTFWEDNPAPYTNVYDKGIGSKQPKGGQVGYGALLHIGSTYGDSLTITATYPGVGRVNPGVSTTKVWVNSSDFGFSFQPEEGVVNKDHWIIPYVKFPDLQLVDFEKIWVTIDNAVAVSVEGADDMFSLSKVINPSTGQPYATMDAAIDAIKACNSETELRRMLGGYFDYFKLKHDETLGWMIEGIYPKIWGLTVGEEADVTIHIVGSTYNGTKKFTNAEATYHVTVVSVGDDLFHWEMNDNAQGHDDKQIKTIYMIEGDYIYMPGIVGNPNGNDDYSKEGAYKYLYGIQQGDIVMNFKPYFWREGIANYFFTYNYQNDTESYSGKKPSTDRLIPTTHTNKADAPEALIFWASGLGDYYRNDSLLIYANKPTNDNQHLYLWAEDPQTGLCCTPIEIKIYSRNSLLAKRQESLEHMTYPFTWDFEHMELCGLEEIKRDAKNGTYYGTNGHNDPGNGGSYWRKRWDSSGGSTLRSPHGIDKDYYQYNGVFNADYDDKDNNYSSYGYDPDGNRVSGSRQRWFKDLSANGTYLDMFKGLRLNIAGLDYWEQKYTRFNVSTKPYGGIYFEGGVHYLSLPGFGINGSAIIADGTRELGTLPMPGSQVHFNTEENNCTVDYFNRGYLSNNNIYSHNPIFDNQNYTNKKNNKVYFVIKAMGNSNRSVIYVGGKSMMLQTNTKSRTSGVGTGTDIGENGTLYSENTDQYKTNPSGVSTNAQQILLADAVDKPKIYAIPLNPWDDDFQEQIYLAFNNGVHVYWMGITTEPRFLREDYETYTYSYPVDLDIDRTNQVMTMLTEEKFGTGNGVNMIPYYGTGYVHANKSLVVDRLLSDKTETRAEGDKALEAEELVNYKIPANEGIVLYPTKRLHDIKKAIGEDAYNAGTEERTVANKTVISVLYDEKGNPKTDASGKILYKSDTYNYTYRFLPTYFIANAQNMHKNTYSANAGGRGVGKTINAANIKPNGTLEVPALDTKSFVYTDGTERKDVPTYNLPNRLTSSPYSTYIFKDYYSKDGQMPTSNNNGVSHKDDASYYHFIALGMTNEYNKRYLDYNEDYDVYKELKDYMHDAQGQQLTPGDPTTSPNDPTQGEFDHVDTKQYYYNLIGPAAVKFYRAGNDNWSKGRRSYMKLTWQEYEVNTVGKIIYSSDGKTPGDEYTQYTPSDPNAGDIGSPGLSSNPAGVKLIFKTNGGNNTNDEELVSEDGGFPDGIEELKQDTDNGVFYNLNGVRVTTPRKGVYIHNGKKVIIK